ncbi:predicted protein [Chaetomium globosum CBS 148.51]|uniref:Uncharacterized protein n=1 Tax=Chaetomium globosum (strain ATCC 6205 / CBS 148.51 / DSM 1962 / NBRC 6347 / NRRL 1970) TaxID=306901 RepID=Q2GS41_CHAGB|nr:uncharacterized protein CHGG_09213 [Chaetomium globosum CBS 148.51]EAQ85199.1 predicted protein [Chaetomium globosum CBS 148.51]
MVHCVRRPPADALAVVDGGRWRGRDHEVPI